MKSGLMTILLITALSCYLLLLAGMTVFQRKLMYLPVKEIEAPAHYGLQNVQDVKLTSEDGTQLHLWYKEAEHNLPTVLYFHGNAGHIGDRASLFGALANKGLGVAMISYRGYGKSEGSPSEKGVYKDARAAVKWLKSRGIPMSEIAFYGESLGTGVAIKTASEYAPKTLFLQAPYTSVINRASEIYWFLPVRLLIRDHYNSLATIPKVKSRVVIFHGAKDDVIPLKHGKTLFEAAAEPKQLFVFDDIQHNDFDNALISQHVLDILTH